MGKKKSRIWIIFIILWIPLLTLELLSTNKQNYRWVFVYYKSYDNNLSQYGEQIIKELSEGISNNEIALVTQIDSSDNKGIKRLVHTFSDGKINVQEKYLANEDSTDTKELEKFFDWVRDNWRAENYCVIFTDHGGMLNSMCFDEKPSSKQQVNEKSPAGKWFRADEVANILADFNNSVDGKVRLLFLQQCGRAAIQNLYSFTDTSQYILASPVRIGAPNTYYTKTLQKVSNDPNITGKTIAETIMKEDEHYNIYTLINTQKLEQLPDKLAPLLDAFSRAEKLAAPQNIRFMFEHTDEKFYDLQTYFNALSESNNNIAQKEMQTFFGWCDTQLVENVSFKNYKSKDEFFIPIDLRWQSGLSIYIPTQKQDLNRYDYLPIYKQSNLKDFHRLTLNK